MAEYQITYWRQIPALVTAHDGRARARRGTTCKVELPPRFQVAIDELAMRAGLIGTDEYLEEWRRGPWLSRNGLPQAVAEAVAKELEQEYTPARIGDILRESL